MTKTANDVAPKLLPKADGLLKRTLYKIGTYLVKISTPKQNAEQEQNAKNTDTPDKKGSQLEALVSYLLPINIDSFHSKILDDYMDDEYFKSDKPIFEFVAKDYEGNTENFKIYFNSLIETDKRNYSAFTPNGNMIPSFCSRIHATYYVRLKNLMTQL